MRARSDITAAFCEAACKAAEAEDVSEVDIGPGRVEQADDSGDRKTEAVEVDDISRHGWGEAGGSCACVERWGPWCCRLSDAWATDCTKSPMWGLEARMDLMMEMRESLSGAGSAPTGMSVSRGGAASDPERSSNAAVGKALSMLAVRAA